jgi:pilus assembly protein Flp/PilA
MTISHQFRRFADDESGATAIEYALVASIISITIAAALSTMRTSLQTTFNDVATGFDR